VYFEIIHTFAASIQAYGKKPEDLTSITGLGDKRQRFFHLAYFLLTNNSVEAERGLHQIDGSSSVMEIVMMFKDAEETVTTNVHVMVNVMITLHSKS